MSNHEKRTKSKRTENGYCSEFIGLDLHIPTDDLDIIDLPIECQVQTMEQYRDGNVGFSAHTKLPLKGIKLKNIPGTGESSRYTDADGKLDYYRSFLSHIMHISPQCSIAKTTGNDFEAGRVVITPYDLYEAFRLISRVPKDSLTFRAYENYLGELYEKRDDLFPSGESLLPEYIRAEDIPNPNVDYPRYDKFFVELRHSLKHTFQEALGRPTLKKQDLDLDALEEVEEENLHDRN